MANCENVIHEINNCKICGETIYKEKIEKSTFLCCDCYGIIYSRAKGAIKHDCPCESCIKITEFLMVIS